MAFTPMFFTAVQVLTGHRALDLRQHVFCYRVNGAGQPTAAELASLNAEFVTRVLNPLRSMSCNDLTWESLKSYDASVPNGAVANLAIASNGQGTRAGFSLPGNVAYALQWDTANRGRSFRGRSFLTNLSEGDVDGDSVTTAFLNIAAVLANAIIGQYVGGRFTFAIGSRKLEGSTAIVRYKLDPIVDAMRRRLSGRGA